ncbi:hypothetical protein [Arcobacter roscoffensis]|uniref:Uncharacterized protein n=1 Tax=Arcobacter roscoffensis TaxID=2961520 RepID=A0ABY5E9R8_9BACT|nr:hypothetical protein [Arcobacter roscoffensis]UTJ07475.1 hypothetical protein NJU99_05105 [Arcobacter roscoffensis]
MLTQQELQIKIDRYTKQPFMYYVEYPESDDNEYFWKDGLGELQFIPDMTMDHLKACINKIKKDIKEFYDEDVRDILIPIAEKKQKQLQAELMRKANS